MGLIREPLDADFVVDSRPLTKEEKEKISNYIHEYKVRHSNKSVYKRTIRVLSSQRKVTD